MIKKKVELDNQRILIIGTHEETIQFAGNQFLDLAKKMIAEKDSFFVALSGGSTPKAIFESIKNSSLHQEINWNKVYLFWSDERAVPPSSKESNYKMAMDALFSFLPIPDKNIFRMRAEEKIDIDSKKYEEIIRELIPDCSFDLVMLGMGDDGHTASLFPRTTALDVNDRLVIENYVPKLDAWRMTFTFECINKAKNIIIYILGKSKAAMVNQALNKEENQQIPIKRVGSINHKALWILDEDAAQNFLLTE